MHLRGKRQERAPRRFGTSFLEWARGFPNLQAELLLSSKHAGTASYTPIGHAEREQWRARWSTPEVAAARAARVWEAVPESAILAEELYTDLKRRGVALQRADIPMQQSQDYPTAAQVDLVAPELPEPDAK